MSKKQTHEQRTVTLEKTRAGPRGQSRARCQGIKRNGVQCNGIAVRGFTVCRVHGAGTRARPGGTAPDPSKPHSRYAVPAHLAKAFEAAANDPHLLEQTQEIHLIDARLNQLLGMLEVNMVNVPGAHRSLQYLKQIPADTNVLAKMMSFKVLERAFNQVESSRQIWLEIENLMSLRKSFVESERRWQFQQGQMVPTRTVIALAAKFHELIFQHVPDPAARRSIAAELRAISNRPELPIIEMEN